jgi:iron complex outermembrane receptor protein
VGPLGTSPLIVNGSGDRPLYANTGANDPITGQLLGNTVDSTPIMRRWRVRPGQVQPHAALSLTLGGRYNYDRNDQRSAISTSIRSRSSASR